MGGTIKGITVEIGGDTTKLGTALKGVNASTKSLQNELRGVNTLLKMDPGNVTLLQQKQDLLNKSIGETKDKLQLLKEKSAEVQQQFANDEITEEQYRDFQREIVATEERLKSLEKEAKNFGSVHSQQIAAAGEKMIDYGDKITDAGKKMSKVSGVIVGVGAAAVKTTADFDGAMSNVQAISGATGDEFTKLRDKAIEMGSKTKFSASESADALTYMAMAGWKSEEMLVGIEGIMNAAAATGTDLAMTSDIITDALTAFGMGANESSRMADVLAKTSNSANTNIEMLGETFQYAAPVCGTLGISLEDCAVAAGLMGNSGIKASQAGTAIRKGLLNLASPTKSVAAAMEQYNIKLIENEDGSINLMKTMQNMRTQLGGLSEAEQTAAISAIAGKNAVSGWAAIVNASEKDFNTLTAAIADSKDAAKEAADIQLDNLKGQITILKSTLEGIAIQIGDILMPTIRAIVEKIQDWTTKFSALDEGTKKIIVVIASIIAAIGPMLLIVGKVVSSIGSILTYAPKIVSAVKSVMGVVSKLGGFLAAHPAVAIIAAIAAVIAIVISLYKNCEPFREFVDNLWEKIKAFFKDVGEWFKSVGEWFKGLWESISEFFEKVKLFFTETIPNTVSEFWNKVKIFFTETIPNAVNAFIEKIKTFFTENWKALLLLIVNPFAGAFKLLYDNCEGFRNFVNGFVEKVKTLFTEGLEKIKTFFTEKIPDLIQKIVTWFSELPSKIYNAIVGTVDKIRTWGDKIKEKATTAIKNLVNGVISNAKTLPGKIANAINGAITTVTTWGSNMVNRARNAMSNVVSGVTSKLKEIPSKVTSIGRDIIEGLWNGINDKVDWIKNKIVGFKDQVLSKLKSVFDIHSPSRLLKTEIGYRLAEGVGEGITESDAPGDAMAKLRKNILSESDGINGITLKRQIENTFKSSGGTDNGLLNRLDAILTKLDKRTQVILDTGALIGETIDGYDKALGEKSTKLARGW